MRAGLSANGALLLAGLVSFALMGAGQSLYGPALPELARRAGAEVSSAGLVISAHWVGSAAGVAAVFLAPGAVAPRLALATMAAGAAGLALAPTLAALIAAAAVFGAGYGLSTTIWNPRVLQAFGERGPAMVGLLNAIFGLGAILAPLGLVALGGAPAPAFAVLAGFCLVLWLAAGGLAAPPPPAQGAARPGVRFDPVILGLGVGAIAIEACLVGLGPLALMAQGFSPAAAATTLSAFFVAFLAIRLGMMLLTRWIAPHVLFVLGLVALAALALVARAGAPGAVFVAMGAAAGLFFPCYYVTAAARMGDDPRVPPIIIGAGLAGGIGAPLLMAPLGPAALFPAMAILALGLAAVGLPALRRMGRPVAA